MNHILRENWKKKDIQYKALVERPSSHKFLNKSFKEKK